MKRIRITTIIWNLENKQPQAQGIAKIIAAIKENQQAVSEKAAQQQVASDSIEELFIVLTQEEGSRPEKHFAKELRTALAPDAALHGDRFMTATGSLGYVGGYYFTASKTTSLSMSHAPQQLRDTSEFKKLNKGALLFSINMKINQSGTVVNIPLQCASMHLDSNSNPHRLAEMTTHMYAFEGNAYPLTFEQFKPQAAQIYGGDSNYRFQMTHARPYDPSQDTLDAYFGFKKDGPENTFVQYYQTMVACGENPAHYATYNKVIGGLFNPDTKRNPGKEDVSDHEYEGGHLDYIATFCAGFVLAQRTRLVKDNPSDGKFDVSDHVPQIQTIEMLIPTDENELKKAFLLKKIERFLVTDPGNKIVNKINALDLNKPTDQLIFMEYYNNYALLRDLHIAVKSLMKRHLLTANQSGAVMEPLLIALAKIISDYFLDESNAVDKKEKFYLNLSRQIDSFSQVLQSQVSGNAEGDNSNHSSSSSGSSRSGSFRGSSRSKTSPLSLGLERAFHYTTAGQALQTTEGELVCHLFTPVDNKGEIIEIPIKQEENAQLRTSPFLGVFNFLSKK